MLLLALRNKAYTISEEYFLMHANQWDDNFVEAMAPSGEK
jgi:hypothetical protein